jgi:hypothetical protein
LDNAPEPIEPEGAHKHLGRQAVNEDAIERRDLVVAQSLAIALIRQHIDLPPFLLMLRDALPGLYSGQKSIIKITFSSDWSVAGNMAKPLATRTEASLPFSGCERIKIFIRSILVMIYKFT